MKRSILFLMLPILALGLLSGCGEKKAAKINNVVIYQKDIERLAGVSLSGGDASLSDYEKDQLKKNEKSILERKITQELVRQGAKEMNIKLDKKMATKELERRKGKFLGAGAFKKKLEVQGMTEQELRKDIEVDVLAGQIKKKLIEGSPEPTNEALRDFYEKNKAGLFSPEEVRVRDIPVASKEVADQVAKEMEQYVPMADLARKYSADPTTKDAGGDVGFFKRGDYGPDFENAAFGMQRAKGLVFMTEINGQTHFIEMLDWKEARQLSFEESIDNLKQVYIVNQANIEFAKWLEKQRKKAKIKIYLD